MFSIFGKYLANWISVQTTLTRTHLQNLIELIFVRIRIHLKEDMVYVKMESCRMILKLLEIFLALFSYCKAVMRLFNMSKDYTSFLEGEQYCTSCVSCYG